MENNHKKTCKLRIIIPNIILFVNDKHFGDFVLSILFYLLVPLFPIYIEWWLKYRIQLTTITLVSSLYCLRIGISSKNKVLFGFGISGSLILAIAFGTISSGNPAPSSDTFALICICFFFIAHTFERWSIHYIGKERLFKCFKDNLP